MTSTETFTELLRHPREVAKRAERGAVRITRRGADDLILAQAGHLEQRDVGLALTARLLLATVRHSGNVPAALHALYPWMSLLSESEQRECADEVGGMMWAAAELGEYRRLLDSFWSWRGTAAAYAAGMPRDDADLTRLPDLPVVARPE
jgi:hypothetical protein